MFEGKVFPLLVSGDEDGGGGSVVPTDQHQASAGVPGGVAVPGCDGKFQSLPFIFCSLKTVF